jgi:hypothetical protein
MSFYHDDEINQLIQQVFELLSALNPALPGFSRDNWVSNIKHHVTVHPNYRTMAPWVGSETTDLVYRDQAGIFTSLLINKGYLLPELWRNKTPKYYIEVKCTEGDPDWPFYMTKPQYEKVSRYFLLSLY